MRKLSIIVGLTAVIASGSAFASQGFIGSAFGEGMLCRPAGDLLNISFDDEDMRLGSITLREGTLPMEAANVVHLSASAISKTSGISFVSVELIALAGEDIAFALSARPVLTKVGAGETVLLQDWIVGPPVALADVTNICVRASKVVDQPGS